MKKVRLLERPEQSEADLAQFRAALKALRGATRIEGESGGSVDLPEAFIEAIAAVADSWGDGDEVTLSTTSQFLTTQEAAEFLGMSRPTLIKALDAGEIPFQRLPHSSHRRVRLRDLLDYEDRVLIDRRAALDDMTSQAAGDGFYSGQEIPTSHQSRQVRHG
jgi:excisionase family DNA binding protein